MILRKSFENRNWGEKVKTTLEKAVFQSACALTRIQEANIGKNIFIN
jgi:hypothetical protein